MSKYHDKVRKLAEVAYANDQRNGEDDLDFISTQLDSIVSYHDRVTRMEQQMQFQKLRLEGEDFRDWLEDQNRSRISSHENMINSVIIINRYCKNNGIEPFYDGKVDEVNRYKDPDTRFGIASMADEYCSEMFRAGIGQNIDKNHQNTIKKALELGEKFGQEDMPDDQPALH